MSSDLGGVLTALAIPHKAAVLDGDVLSVCCKHKRFLERDELLSVLELAGEVGASFIALYIDGVCFSFPYLAYIDMLLTASSFESFVRTWDIACRDYRFATL